MDNWTHEAHILDGLRITPESLREEAKNFDIFVMEESSSRTIAGCVKTGIVKETVVGPLPEPTGYIGLLAVAGRFQSRGLGKRLMKFAEDHCRLSGVDRVSLDVLGVREDIIAWYERCGYRKTGHPIDSAPFFKAKGEILLMPASFILLQKTLTHQSENMSLV
ncbi:unnamed protein product [Agarophyton chilense]